MWEYDHQKIPKSLTTWFEPKHSYSTRFVNKGKLKITKFNTNKFGKYSFRFEGTKILNLLKDENIYNESSTKKHLQTRLKQEFYKTYTTP